MTATLNVLPVLLITLGALVVLIFIARGWTSARQADYAATVQKNDLTFQQLATAIGLEFTPGRVTHHPVVGDIAAFGTVQGTYRGHRVTLQVAPEETTEPPVPFRLQLMLDAAPGTSFTPAATTKLRRLTVEPTRLILEPQIPSYARSASYEFFILTDTQALKASLDELCDVAEAAVQR